MDKHATSATENSTRYYMLWCCEARKCLNCTPLLSVSVCIKITARHIYAWRCCCCYYYFSHCSRYSAFALLSFTGFFFMFIALTLSLPLSLTSRAHSMQSHHVSLRSSIVRLKSSVNLFVELFVAYGSPCISSISSIAYCFPLSSWFNNFILLLRAPNRVVCLPSALHRFVFGWMDLCKRCLCYVWTHLKNKRGIVRPI